AAIRLDPRYAGAYNGRAAAYTSRGEYEQAMVDHIEAIRLDPKVASVFADFAKLWVTDQSNRSVGGHLAVELATRACELSGWSDGSSLSMLAAAYAEIRNFPE